jgi:hypothetical protein
VQRDRWIEDEVRGVAAGVPRPWGQPRSPPCRGVAHVQGVPDLEEEEAVAVVHDHSPIYRFQEAELGVDARRRALGPGEEVGEIQPDVVDEDATARRPRGTRCASMARRPRPSTTERRSLDTLQHMARGRLCIIDTRYGYGDTGTAIREFEKRHSGSIERVSEYRSIKVLDTHVLDTVMAGLLKYR